MITRLQQLSTRLSQIINFEGLAGGFTPETRRTSKSKVVREGKTRYKLIKPYLTGSEYDNNTTVGKATAVAVHARRIEPFAESIERNPAISDEPRVVKRSLIQQNQRKDATWLVGDNDSELRKAKGADLVRPTEVYAKVKTRGLIARHQSELQKMVAEAPGEVGAKRAQAKFEKLQRERSGERPAKFSDRARIRAGHQEEIGNIRSHIAQTVLENRAIVKGHNARSGSKLHESEIPDVLSSHRKNLDDMVESHVASSTNKRQSMLAKIEGGLSEAIAARHVSEGNAAASEAHVAKVVRQHMAILHEPTEHTVDKMRHYGHLASLTGKTPEQVADMHKEISDLATESSEGARAIHRKNLIKSGKLFEHVAAASPAPRTDLKKFPLLKAAGVAGAIGAVGAGIAIHRHNKKKKEEQLQMRSRTPLIMFGKKEFIEKKTPKINQYAQELIKKSNLRKAADAPKNPLKSLKDIPRELVTKPPWKQVESHAIQNVDIIKSQVAKRKKEALGQIFSSHTAEGLKQIQSSALRQSGNVGDLIRATRAIESAKSGLGKGIASKFDGKTIHIQHAEPKIPVTGPKRGSIAQRALGGYIGRDPALLRPTQKRQFNIDVAAINRDKKTYDSHRKWMADMGQPIGTMRQRRQGLARKIKTWKTQAVAGEMFERGTQGLKEQLTKAEKTIVTQGNNLENIRRAGQDFPRILEDTKKAAYNEADTDATRKLKGAKEHWQGAMKRGAEQQRNQHAAQTKKLKRSINTKVAIGAGAGATAGGAAGYEVGKEKKKKETQFSEPTFPQKIRNKARPHQSTTTHDILTGGAEGAAGILATDPLLKRIHGGSWESPFAGSKKILGKKLAAGAAVGAIATGLIGAGVSAIAKRRKERENVFSAKPMKILKFDVQPTNRTAVTRDRYGKKIHVEDMTKSENNYVRTALGGAAISTLLRKRSGLSLKPAALIGAGAGIGVQAIVRNRTAKTKDQFGDRSYAAKRIDNAPGQAAILAAGGLAAHSAVASSVPYRNGLRRVGRGLKKAASFIFASRAKPIRFDEYDDATEDINRRIRQRRKEQRRIEDYTTYAKRGGRLVRDVKAKIEGKQVLDARGREKTKEWDRPWVRNAATAAIIGATGAGIAGVKHVSEDPHVQSDLGGFMHRVHEGIAGKAVARAAERNIPPVAKAAQAVRKVRGQFRDEVASATGQSSLLAKANRWIDKHAESTHEPDFERVPVAGGGEMRYYKGGEGYAKLRRKKMSGAEKIAHSAEKSVFTKIERAAKSKPVLRVTDWFKKTLSSRLQPIRFAEAPGQYDDDWEDWLRSRPGVAKRNRRPKTVFEKEENKKVVNRAKIGAALVAGTLIGSTFRRPSPQIIKKFRNSKIGV